jgi:DNA-binding MarR family transcriptional regulator
MFLRERKNNPPSQKDIAEAFGISSAAVAISIKNLEDAGLVSKNVFDKDNRVNNITLTEKGLKTADITTETVYKAFDRVFSVLSGDEIITMCKCLEKINNALEQ